MTVSKNIIPKYKCRECHCVFMGEKTEEEPSQFAYHKECGKNYIGFADLQGFRIIE